MHLDWGARSSRSPPVGPRASVCPTICSVLPPTGLGWLTIHLLVSRCKDSDAFGETPKAADEDVRAPNFNCIVAAQIKWQNIASRSLGSNQVLLGGMTPPVSAMAIKSPMPVGYMAKAQTYSLLLTSFSNSAAPRMPPTNWMLL